MTDILDRAQRLAELAEQARRIRTAPAPANPNGDWWYPLKCPEPHEIHQAYSKRFVRRDGRPFHLPTYRAIYPEDRPNRGWDATNCLGPRDDSNRSRIGKAFMCNKHNFCAFCWERRRRRAGLLAGAHHIGDPVVVKHSLSLPGDRTDPERVLKARQLWVRYLKREGFEHVTAYVHTFGENPAQGPKGHLDVIASGTDCSIDSLVPDLNPRIHEILKPFHVRPDQGFYEPWVDRTLLAEKTRKKQLNTLILAGMYAGRGTLHVRRVLAGMYGQPGDPRVHLTTVSGKKGEQVKPMKIAGKSVPDWTYADLYRACITAEDWDAAIGRPTRPRGVKMKPSDIELLLRDTRWRFKYRLGMDDEIRAKYQ